MENAAILLVALMIAVAALSALAQRVGVPYPIVLVVGGLLLGVVPGVPQFELGPDLVFLVFLPPLLFYAAVLSSLRDLKQDIRAIGILAFGLVAATMAVVAVVAKLLVPGMPWPVAVTLGAILSPTDPVAATSVMSRLGVPRRVRTVVEGESLLNDTGALLAFRFAVAAVVGQSFSWWDVAWRLPVTALGGIAIGLAVGWGLAWIRQRLHDTPVEVTLSLVTPYAAYLPADRVGVSAVLAVVSAGLLTAWRSPMLFSSSDARLDTFSVWASLVFIGNAVLFLLVGLQLPVVLGNLQDGRFWSYLTFALLVTGAIVVLRLGWQFSVIYLIRAVDRRPQAIAQRIGAKERFLVGWSGMRGAVSLAAALSVPQQLGDQPFPNRELIIFTAFVVVLLTLLAQGLSLSPLIRALHLPPDDSTQQEERYARRAAADAALGRIDQLGNEDWTRDDTIERLRGLYRFRRRRFADTDSQHPADEDGADPNFEDPNERSVAYQRVVHSVLDAQRQQLLRMRNDGEIGDDTLRRIQRDLDLEDSRLEL